MLQFPVPPGYRGSRPVVIPLDPFIAIIDRLLKEDSDQPKKLHYTKKLIFERSQKQTAAYQLLIIDAPGFMLLSKTGAQLLFKLISQRYEWGPP